MAMADVISRLSVLLSLDTAAFEQGADISEKRLKKMEREFTKLGDKISAVGKKFSLAITTPVLAAGAAVVKSSADFEASMIKLGISSQATAAEMREMSDLALKLGKDTIFGASDAANAMDELAKTGLSAREILDGAATAAVNLASATGSELSPAANAITDTMQQFGLSTAQLPDAVNQITGAVNQSKLDFADYALAIGQAGGVAGGLGVDFTDFNTVLAATSSLFASGSDAGTSFKTFLTALTGNSKQAKEAIDQFGLSFFDANGGLRSMAEIAEELRGKLGGLNDQAKTEVLKKIFGTDAMRTAIALMDQGADGLDKVAAAIKRTDAAAQAQERLKGFYGQLENLKGAVETLAIRIGQSGVLEAFTALITKIGDFVDWLSEVNPGILRFTVVAGGIVAAVGPAALAIGALTRTFAPLLTLIKVQIIPAMVLFKMELAALAVAGGPAAVAMRVLTVAVRGLLIATGVGLAITALAGAIYLMTRRTNEATPAAKAYGQALASAKQTADDARIASEKLSTAQGKERETALRAAMAQRELAAQRLKAAQASLIDAEARVKTARAEAKLAADRTRIAANDPRLMPGIDRSGAETRARQASANAKAAEETVLTLLSAKADIGRAIAAANAPINLPKVNAGGIAGEGGGSRDGRTSGSTSAKDALASLMERLFPEEAEMREAQTGLQLLKKSLDAGKISADRYSEAVAQLWRNFLGGHSDGWMSDGLSSMTESIEKISDQISGRFVDAMEKLAEKSGLTKTMVVKSFKDMADETMSALSRLSDAIRGGGFLDILQGIVGLGLQLGSIGAFGRKIAANINRPIGQNANGTSYWRGGLSLVGERGPELVDLPRGARVTPNNQIGGLNRVEIVDTTGLFRFRVNGQIMEAAPGIASAGAAGGVSQIQRHGSRRLA